MGGIKYVPDLKTLWLATDSYLDYALGGVKHLDPPEDFPTFEEIWATWKKYNYSDEPISDALLDGAENFILACGGCVVISDEDEIAEIYAAWESFLPLFGKPEVKSCQISN